MKTIITFALLASIFACNKTERGFDTLTEEEKQYLRTQAQGKCLSDSERTFLDFQDKSNEQFIPSSSTNFRVNKTWLWTEKKAEASMRTKKFTVWKVTTLAVYFIVTEIDAYGATSYKFLKIDSATNSDMIADLKIKKCKAEADFITVTNNSSSATLTYEPAEFPNGSTQRDKVVQTFTYSFSELAYFGSLHERRTRQIIENSNNTVSSTENYTTDIVAKADEAPAYSSYTNYSSAEYCVVAQSSGVFAIPYKLTCTSDASGTAGNWTNPGSEL